MCRPSQKRQHRLKCTSYGTILGLSGNVPIQPPDLGSNKHTPHEGESRDITTIHFTTQVKQLLQQISSIITCPNLVKSYTRHKFEVQRFKLRKENTTATTHRKKTPS